MRPLLLLILAFACAQATWAQSVSTGTWDLSGSSEPGSQAPPPSGPTLVSIVVTPGNLTDYIGAIIVYTATGVYSDGSTQDLSASSNWSSGDTGVALLLPGSNEVNCVAPGSSSIVVRNGLISGNTTVTCVPSDTGGNAYCTPSGTWIGPATDGPAALPAVCYYTAGSGTPSPGTVRGPVNSVATFNAAYSAAACGDVIQIAAGSSLSGPVTLTGKGCDDQHYITVESTGVGNPSFPAEGTRATPCMSNIASLPNRPAYSCPAAQMLTAKFVAPASGNAVVLNGADHIRFIGIEFTRVSTPAVPIYNLVDLSSSAPRTNHIIFDRVWLHGIDQDGNFPQNTSTDTSTTRAIYLAQSNYVALIDSYCSDFYDNGSTASNGNTDAQCVGGGAGGVANSGWGVYKFVNNHMEGASESILLGGSGGPQNTPSGCTFGVNCNLDVPQHIEVRRNYFFKSPGWFGNGASTGWPNVKNGVEFKTGANILLEGNVFENCWYNSQPYCYVFDFAPKNQSNGAGVPTCPSCLVQDFVARYNYGYNYPGMQIAIYSTMDMGCSTCTTLGRRGSVHDNLVGDKLNRAGVPGLTGYDGIEFLASAGPMTSISLRHNTIVNAFRSGMVFGASRAGWFDQIVFQDNLVHMGNYGILNGTGGGCDKVGDTFYTVLNNCVNGTNATWTVDHNTAFAWITGTIGPLGHGWPTNGSGSGNFFYSGTAAVGFTNYGTADSGLNPGNYQLLSTSPLHNAGSDGKDIGADIPTLLTKIAGVRD